MVSDETTDSAGDFDKVMKNVAFGYDNSLSLLAYLSRGTADDMSRAKLIADAFVYALNNENGSMFKKMDDVGTISRAFGDCGADEIEDCRFKVQDWVKK